MNLSTDPRRSALVVHAHPEPASFTTAQMEAATRSLQAVGYRVDVRDLYARAWNPVLSRHEFAPLDEPFKPQREQWNAFRAGTLAPEVRAELTAVLDADLLVLSFPLWWFSAPAILKGWLDRVFVMGGVSGGDAGLFETAALAGRRGIILTTTGGSTDAFTADGAFGDVNQFLFHLNRGVLEFVGYDALAPVITFGPAHLDAISRARALRDVERAFADLDARPSAVTSRLASRSER